MATVLGRGHRLLEGNHSQDTTLEAKLELSVSLYTKPPHLGLDGWVGLPTYLIPVSEEIGSGITGSFSATVLACFKVKVSA